MMSFIYWPTVPSPTCCQVDGLNGVIDGKFDKIMFEFNDRLPRVSRILKVIAALGCELKKVLAPVAVLLNHLPLIH